jgi:hypoxanthine phosphoribosyltransferase
MRTLSWQAFDQAVERIAANVIAANAIAADNNAAGCSGVFGVPRGGLVLAVALSHRLSLPLLHQAEPGCLVVDDVYETGLTLEPYRHLDNARVAVWISKAEPQWWQAVEVTSSSEWLVFPWEHGAAAAADEQLYRASRA